MPSPGMIARRPGTTDKKGRIRSGIESLFAPVVSNPVAPVELPVPVGIAFSAEPGWLMKSGFHEFRRRNR